MIFKQFGCLIVELWDKSIEYQVFSIIKKILLNKVILLDESCFL